jgi:hypothetical protein
MVNWSELNKLRDEIDGLEARGSLTYAEFQHRFELAEGYCKDSPRMLEAFIRRAPTEWVAKHLAEPIAALSESSEELKLVPVARTRSYRQSPRSAHAATGYRFAFKAAAKPAAKAAAKPAAKKPAAKAAPKAAAKPAAKKPAAKAAPKVAAKKSGTLPSKMKGVNSTRK